MALTTSLTLYPTLVTHAVKCAIMRRMLPGVCSDNSVGELLYVCFLSGFNVLFYVSFPWFNVLFYVSFPWFNLLLYVSVLSGSMSCSTCLFSLVQRLVLKLNLNRYVAEKPVYWS